jgi:hypothetical protein
MSNPATYPSDLFAEDFCSKVKRAIAEVIRKSSLSRIQIVDRMNECAELAGQEPKMTVDILNSWTRNDPKRKINANDIMYFCYATENMDPVKVLLQPFKGFWLPEEKFAAYEFGVSKLEEYTLNIKLSYEKKIQDLILDRQKIISEINPEREKRISRLFETASGPKSTGAEGLSGHATDSPPRRG